MKYWFNLIIILQQRRYKKQAPKKGAHRIDAYLFKNNIIITKPQIAQTLLSDNISIQTINKKEAKKLRMKNDSIKVLGTKAKLAQKQYKIVALGIFIAKIDLKKVEKTKKK